MSVCPICHGQGRTSLYCIKGYEILECKACGGYSLGEAPLKVQDDSRSDYETDYFGRGATSEKLTGYFNYEAELELHIKNFAQYLKQIRLHAKGNTLLDVGCASGHFLLAARKSGFLAKGLDVSAAATARVRELGFEAWTGDPASIDISERFDVITLWETIEHVPDPDPLLQRIKKWLKPDGILMIGTGDNTSLVSRMLGKRWWYFVPPDHVVYYNPRALEIALKRNGYQIESSGHVVAHWVSSRNAAMKLMRSFAVKPSLAIKVAGALPEIPLKILHGTTMLVAARPELQSPASGQSA